MKINGVLLFILNKNQLRRNQTITLPPELIEV